MTETWLSQAVRLGSEARERRFEEARAQGAQWMLECREMWDAHDGDGGAHFRICQDYPQASKAVAELTADPSQNRLLGIFSLRQTLNSQGMGLTSEEFFRRGRPISISGASLGGAGLWRLNPRHGLALLCDPISANEDPASWVLEDLPQSLQVHLDQAPTGGISKITIRLLQETSQKIWQRGQRERLLDGVGAAVVVAYLRGNEEAGGFDYFVTWAGDCRGYLWRDGELKALTVDDLDRHMPAHRPLVQYLGIGNLDPHCCSGSMDLQTRLLLCNHAAAVALKEAEITQVLGSVADPERASQELLGVAHGKKPRERHTLVLMQPQN